LIEVLNVLNGRAEWCHQQHDAKIGITINNLTGGLYCAQNPLTDAQSGTRHDWRNGFGTAKEIVHRHIVTIAEAIYIARFGGHDFLLAGPKNGVFYVRFR
jgi:hypothetical protein